MVLCIHRVATEEGSQVPVSYLLCPKSANPISLPRIQTGMDAHFRLKLNYTARPIRTQKYGPGREKEKNVNISLETGLVDILGARKAPVL